VLHALPGLIEQLGGPTHADCLVPPLLELLEQTPEPSVRDAVRVGSLPLYLPCGTGPDAEAAAAHAVRVRPR